MTDSGTVGSRDIFAVEYAFSPDPDEGKAALPEEAVSWGHFTLWVNGLNLCQSSYRNETCDTVRWYLYPLISWLSQNWWPLLYEEQPPVPTEKIVARTIFFEYAKQSFGFMDEEKGNAWYHWGQRHSLRSCSNGGIFPDLFIRAFGDHIEFSWGNAELPGMPKDFFFTAPYGSQTVERNEVKNVLSRFLYESTDFLLKKMPESKKIQTLYDSIQKITKYDKEQHLIWMIPALRDKTENSRNFLEKFKGLIATLDQDFIPAPILMFGSFSPSLQESDIDIIVNSLNECKEDHVLIEFVKYIPIPDKRQYESGYSLSLDFIDSFCEQYKAKINLESILKKLKIRILEMNFSDTDMRGIAMAGKDITPTIFINMSHHNNKSKNGKRFTIAHEFCHLLCDRQYGQEVGISSGPWAPFGVEKRANAFAAMLLMPPSIIEKKLTSINNNLSMENIQNIATDLQVSTTALIEHLYNLGAISILERDKLRQPNLLLTEA
jgi:Zn-dependent peptidase ImmA (M78 family)